MKILYISQYFPPEMGAPAARVHELARHWVQQGHQVAVLTGFPNHPTGIVPPEYRSKWKRLIWKEQMDGIEVVRAWLVPLPNRKRHERMLNYASFALSSALVGTFLSRPDIVIATSPQLLVGMTGWWVSRVKRSPFVLEVRDLWPESLEAVGVSSKNSALYRVLESIARFLYRRSGHIVVVTPSFKDYLTAKWGVRREKISVVENGVETELFSPGDAHGMRRALGLDNQFVLSYVGTLGMAHGLGTLLKAAEHFSFAEGGVTFLLVGEGAEKDELRECAARHGLRNVVFLGQQPRTFMPAILRASDACLILLKRREIFKTVIPTKLLECMSCGRPVILGVEGQAREIVEQAQAGLCFEPENVGSLVSAIQELRSDSALRRRLGENGRRWIAERLSRAGTAAAYLDVLCALRGPRVPDRSSPLQTHRASIVNPRLP